MIILIYNFNMSVRLTKRLLLYDLLFTVSQAACPDDQWIKRPDSPYCYRVFERADVSWNTGGFFSSLVKSRFYSIKFLAESECNKYGADLVSYESAAEMTWVYNQMNWNQGNKSWVGSYSSFVESRNLGE